MIRTDLVVRTSTTPDKKQPSLRRPTDSLTHFFSLVRLLPAPAILINSWYSNFSLTFFQLTQFLPKAIQRMNQNKIEISPEKGSTFFYRHSSTLRVRVRSAQDQI